MRYEKDIGTEKYLHGIGVEATEKTNRWGDSTKEFFTHDDLGSSTRKYDDRGKTQNTYDYDIFGVPSFREDSHSYTGYTNDTSTNLMYAQARYYLPEVGRFISEDSYTGTLSNSQSQNRYIYCINNPMKYVDPSGHNAETKWYESPNWQNVPLAGPLVYLGEGVYNLATGNSPSDGIEGWSERTLNSGVNTFFTAAILCDLGVGTGALTFGKGVRHFEKTDAKPITGNVAKPKLNIQLFGEKSVANMNEFFKKDFGKSIKNSATKTSKQYQGQSVYKISDKVSNPYLKKGDQFYLDNLHKDHLEVFKKDGVLKAVLNLNGSLNIEKTEKAYGRILK